MAFLNYHHLRYFRAIASEGTLTGAAKRLNLSQSALSIQLRSLEDSLGQTLFLRALQNVFLQKRRLSLPDLYDPPLTTFGQDAVERWFTEPEVESILKFTDTLAI